MFGVIIVFFSTLFDEISSSIAKAKLEQEQISIYGVAMINYFTTFLIFISIIIFKREFLFSFASLPTLSVRAILEIILTYPAFRALVITDRSTFGFIRVVTIPLLLSVDIFLGYKMSLYQLSGIGLIIFALLFILYNRGINKQGAWFTLATSVLAVATISLYKYDITYYNSVAVEQTIIYAVLSFFLLPLAIFKAKENPFKFFKQKIFCLQSLLSAIPGLLNSFAYIFAPASVILSAYRSSSVFWSVVSGKAYFKERHLLIKIFCLALLISGVILLTF